VSGLRASVVIPTRGRDALLERCLRALLAQDLAPSEYEILVADDGARTATRLLVERYARWAGASGPPVRYLAVTRAHGPAAARNAGWQAAHAPVIAFTDDDCIPSPGWLRGGLEAMRNEMVVGASGRLVMPLSSYPTDYELNAARLAEGQFITANCFYRRSALELVGGFDERFTAAWREDSDLQFTLMERCMVLVFAPEAIVTHPIRPAPWHISLSQQRRNAFNPLLYKKHPALYHELVQSSPPWRYYVILATLLGALAGMITRRPRVALAGGALWTLLTGAFCARRLVGTSHAPGHVAAMLVTSALLPPLAVYWRLRGALHWRVLFL
jgi:cellulose synthase/poly-beta-1,6-N-acetylglucosamine synthase-like glycosyltransferase